MFFIRNDFELFPPKLYPKHLHHRGQSWSYCPYTFPIYNPYPFNPLIRRLRVVERKQNFKTNPEKSTINTNTNSTSATSKNLKYKSDYDNPQSLKTLPSAIPILPSKTISKIPIPIPVHKFPRISKFTRKSAQSTVSSMSTMKNEKNCIENNGSISFLLRESHRRSISQVNIRRPQGELFWTKKEIERQGQFSFIKDNNFAELKDIKRKNFVIREESISFIYNNDNNEAKFRRKNLNIGRKSVNHRRSFSK